MFKFSLRELFGLVLIVALALGWWLDHRRLAPARDEARAWRLRVGTLEHVVRRFVKITWLDNYSSISAENEGFAMQVSSDQYEPSPSANELPMQ